MENNYYCPECKSQLLVGGHIVITAKTEEEQGILFFEPKLGNYKITKNPNFNLKTGEHAEFFCPVCHTNLSTKDDCLAQICLKDSHGDEYEVWFSEFVGEEATYKIRAGKVAESYGKDSVSYMNHFGM